MDSTSHIPKSDIPYVSIKVRAFSRKDGLPSMSSKASRIGLPITMDLVDRRLLPMRPVIRCNKQQAN